MNHHEEKDTAEVLWAIITKGENDMTLGAGAVSGYLVVGSKSNQSLVNAFWEWCSLHRQPFICFWVNGEEAELSLNLTPWVEESEETVTRLLYSHQKKTGSLTVKYGSVICNDLSASDIHVIGEQLINTLNTGFQESKGSIFEMISL